MKSIFISLISFLICISATSQQSDSIQKPQLTEQNYLQKSKNQKTTAWILLGGGTGMVLVAGVIGAGEAGANVFNAMGGNEIQSTNADDILFIAGTAAMLGSIPFFIAAGKNKKRAANMALNLKFEKAYIVKNYSREINYYPALSLSMSLK